MTAQLHDKQLHHLPAKFQEQIDALASKQETNMDHALAYNNTIKTKKNLRNQPTDPE
jgi:hypothetical protein